MHWMSFLFCKYSTTTVIWSISNSISITRGLKPFMQSGFLGKFRGCFFLYTLYVDSHLPYIMSICLSTSSGTLITWKKIVVIYKNKMRYKSLFFFWAKSHACEGVCASQNSMSTIICEILSCTVIFMGLWYTN
jgi:hypothetical protein